MEFHQAKTKGFTLIEMIVSLAIFSIIVTMSVGSLLALIAANQKLQSEQSVMTNLTFALDSMTREVRTGTAYVCAGVNSHNADVPGLGKIFDTGTAHNDMDKTKVKDCKPNTYDTPGNIPKYQGVSFMEAGDSITGATSDRIMYYFDREAETIMRKVGNETPQSVVSSGLKILDAKFIVTGADSPSTSGSLDSVQPTVTVFISAQEIGSDKTYRLETTVTQRILDL